MLKPIISIFIIIILSLLVVIATPYAQQILNWVLTGHEWILQILANIFNGGEAGSTIRNSLALLAIPLLIGVIPVVIYWLARRNWFPYFLHVVWAIWLAQTAVLLIQGKMG